MPQALIFANGRMENPVGLNPASISSSFVICADGGVENCNLFGAEPDVIIGDLDSLQPGDLTVYRSKGVEVKQYPSQKDETDLELALLYAHEKKYDEVIILGALGARWDMTIANILLIAHPKFHQINIRLLDGTQELLLFRSGTQYIIHGKPGDTISLIPLTGDVAGVTTSGLLYPLTDENLQFGATRGISNILTHDEARVSIKEGLLLCVINRDNNESF